jgi:hypothetical protein
MQATRWLRRLPRPAARAVSAAIATWCPPRFPQVRAVARRALLPEAVEYLGLIGQFVDGNRAPIFGPALRDLATSTTLLHAFQRALDGATARDAAGRLSAG